MSMPLGRFILVELTRGTAVGSCIFAALHVFSVLSIPDVSDTDNFRTVLTDVLRPCYTDGMARTKGSRRLCEFLRRAELTGAQLAQMSGLEPMQIYHLTNGRRRASLLVAVRLEKATRGAVPAESWLQ